MVTLFADVSVPFDKEALPDWSVLVVTGFVPDGDVVDVELEVDGDVGVELDGDVGVDDGVTVLVTSFECEWLCGKVWFAVICPFGINARSAANGCIRSRSHAPPASTTAATLPQINPTRI